jgi:aspartyl-tRNA(Asn)/glutamyl-tRNA(Gln) amidotransferase subunit A
LKILEDCGAEIYEMDFPSWKYALMCYYILAPSEASSNLARFDGVRYGLRASDKSTLQDMYMNSRTQGFGDEVKRRILIGSFVLSAGKYESFYLKAEQARISIRKEFKKAFEKVNCILTPTTPEAAFPIDSKKDPIQMYHTDVYTAPVNLAGLPAVSVPIGIDKKGLPLGIQIIGNFFQELTLFKLAFLVEKKVKFRKLRRKEAK